MTLNQDFSGRLAFFPAAEFLLHHSQTAIGRRRSPQHQQHKNSVRHCVFSRIFRNLGRVCRPQSFRCTQPCYSAKIRGRYGQHRMRSRAHAIISPSYLQEPSWLLARPRPILAPSWPPPSAQARARILGTKAQSGSSHCPRSGCIFFPPKPWCPG